MGGGSGGGQQGGSVVQYTDPAAAMRAGMLGVAAASEASQQSTAAINSAIESINKNYAQARYDVQPYRTEGVQALNKLNQYLQLDPYNPGNAPEVHVTEGQQRDYINQHSMLGPNPRDPNAWTNGNLSYMYNGVYDPKTNGGMMNGEQIGPVADFFNQRAGFKGSNKDNLGLSTFYGDPNLMNTVKQHLTQEQLDDPAFKRDVSEWEQNKKWYDQYTAEGPLNSDQIFDRISNLPGYQAQLHQGSDAIAKNSSAKGYLGSGRLVKELMGFGQNTLSTFYNDELGRLASLAGSGQQAASQSGQYGMQAGQSIGSLLAQSGDNRANSTLAAGNSLAQAIIASNQQFKVVGGSKGGGGGGMGGIGSLLSGIGSLAGAFSGMGV